MSLRFTQDEVLIASGVLASIEDNGEDIVMDHVAAIPEDFFDAIESNTKEFGSVQTFTAGILAGLIIANNRNLTK